MPHAGDVPSVAKNKKFRKWLILIVAIAIAIAFFIVGEKKEPPKDNGLVQPQYPYVSLNTFPDGKNEIVIPIGPTRWEGVNLPLDAVAYKVDATVWRQIRTWKGKDGPVLKKGQQAFIPIPRNQNISQATFWVRGEGEATVSIERK